MSSTPKVPKRKSKSKYSRISTPVTDSGSERNVTPKPKAKPKVVTKTEPFALPASSESGGNPLWLVMFIVVTSLIAILAVPGPAQDKAYKLALGWGVIGNSRATKPSPKIRTKVKILADEEKRGAIVNAFEHSYFAYERDAFGWDEYHPISRSGTNLTMPASPGQENLNIGIGYTIIDSLSTLLIMSHSHPDTLLPAYRRAKSWVRNNLDFNAPRDRPVSVFETTIRVLAGLLSADWLERDYFKLEREKVYVGEKESERALLNTAADLAWRLSSAFDTTSGLPLSLVDLRLREGIQDPDPENKGLVSTAEVGTLQLEFRYLSHLLTALLAESNKGPSEKVPQFLYDEYGEHLDHITASRLWDMVEGVMLHTREGTRGPRLPSVFINPADGNFVIAPIRLGSRGDSYFEYLLKQYLQTERTEQDLLRMYNEAMSEIHTHLIQRTPKKGILYVAELNPEEGPNGELSWRREPKQDHLVCFLAGSLLLGAVSTRGGGTNEWASIPPTEEELNVGDGRAARDWKTGLDLLNTCIETHKTNTGLAPEIAHFRTPHEPQWVSQVVSGEWYIKGSQDGPPPLDARYILRPETVESLFIAYRLTGDPKYRRWGWNIFEAIQANCRVPTGGYVGLLNVDDKNAGKEDKMETFFLSETLKYLYLLFSEDTLLPLEEVVFNTEAHPLPRFKPLRHTPFMPRE